MKIKKLLVTTAVAVSLMIPTIASASSSFTFGTRWAANNGAYAWASYDYHMVYAKCTWGGKSTVTCGGFGYVDTSSQMLYNGTGNPYATVSYQ